MKTARYVSSKPARDQVPKHGHETSCSTGEEAPPALEKSLLDPAPLARKRIAFPPAAPEPAARHDFL